MRVLVGQWDILLLVMRTSCCLTLGVGILFGLAGELAAASPPPPEGELVRIQHLLRDGKPKKALRAFRKTARASGDVLAENPERLLALREEARDFVEHEEDSIPGRVLLCEVDRVLEADRDRDVSDRPPPLAIQDDGKAHELREPPAIEPPVLLRRVQPQYTDVAMRARFQGAVSFQVVIDRHGCVKPGSVRLLDDAPYGLDGAVIRATRQWVFKPATLNGKPVAVYWNTSSHFLLQ